MTKDELTDIEDEKFVSLLMSDDREKLMEYLKQFKIN